MRIHLWGHQTTSCRRETPARSTTRPNWLWLLASRAATLVSDALNHVAGAMVLNDVSARDLQLANQLWTGGKVIDTFAPCGPWLTSVEDAGNLMNLPVATRLNGQTLQNYNTKNMIFGVAEVISVAHHGAATGRHHRKWSSGQWRGVSCPSQIHSNW